MAIPRALRVTLLVVAGLVSALIGLIVFSVLVEDFARRPSRQMSRPQSFSAPALFHEWLSPVEGLAIAERAIQRQGLNAEGELQGTHREPLFTVRLRSSRPDPIRACLVALAREAVRTRPAPTHVLVVWSPGTGRWSTFSVELTDLTACGVGPLSADDELLRCVLVHVRRQDF